MKKPYLIVEDPAREATVDFLSHGVSVELSIVDGQLLVVAKMSHGEDASTWDRHEVDWNLPGQGPARCIADGCNELTDDVCVECGRGTCEKHPEHLGFDETPAGMICDDCDHKVEE